jgi:hypothetical protein
MFQTSLCPLSDKLQPDTSTWGSWLTSATSMRPTSTAASARDSKNCQPRIIINPVTALMSGVHKENALSSPSLRNASLRKTTTPLWNISREARLFFVR